MSTRRNISRALTRTRHIARVAPALGLAVVGGTLATMAACADSPTSPGAPAAQQAIQSSPTVQAAVVDTTVTTFVVGNDTGSPATFQLGNGSRIVFPNAVGSICDPNKSSYGPGTWDDACTRARKPITITAKTWVDPVTGKTATDFQPALRFVPGASVRLYLKDPNYVPADAIWYCTSGGCVNEVLSDPSVATAYEQGSQWVYRVVKHFSGYMVMSGLQ